MEKFHRLVETGRTNIYLEPIALCFTGKIEWQLQKPKIISSLLCNLWLVIALYSLNTWNWQRTKRNKNLYIFWYTRKPFWLSHGAIFPRQWIKSRFCRMELFCLWKNIMIRWCWLYYIIIQWYSNQAHSNGSSIGPIFKSPFFRWNISTLILIYILQLLPFTFRHHCA